MKRKLDPQEKARRQGWRDERYRAHKLEEEAKRLRGESPLPQTHRTTPTLLTLATAAAIIGGNEAPQA